MAVVSLCCDRNMNDAISPRVSTIRNLDISHIHLDTSEKNCNIGGAQVADAVSALPFTTEFQVKPDQTEL